MPRKAIYTAIKWGIVLATFAYLGYKLITFKGYEEFIEQWRQTPPRQFLWLAGVFLLLPLNWCLEAFKWKAITSSHLQKLTFIEALKGVLAGITTGFLTPNRMGDLVGRAFFLKKEHRLSGITLSLLNSLTQNIVIILCGLPTAFVLFSQKTMQDYQLSTYFLCTALLLIVLILFYLSLPLLSKKTENTRFGTKIEKFIHCLSAYSAGDLVRIILLSLLRYIVFSSQFFFMLCFFNVQLTLWQALLVIPTNYLFVTFTPSIAFSEIAVRASYAIFVIGIFSPQTINIALAGISIWTINWVIPLLAGIIVVLKRKGI